MNEEYGIETIHNALKQKMVDYISTVYLGKNDDLRLTCEKELNKTGTLYQEAYIEANEAYKVRENGIQNMNIPLDRNVIKDSLIRLSEEGLGVFKNPYEHQIKAIEAFSERKDVFVATGTGSGKTECFIWPIVSKLIEEAHTNPKSWEKRGIRVMMLYPMNALVSDQIGRLRSLIGDREGRFHSVFDEFTDEARVPQFGMYTGRTAYPGLLNLDKDKELATTIEKDLLNTYDSNTQNNEYLKKENAISELIKLGKYPAKKNLDEFVRKLYDGIHYTYDKDAELITRAEIRKQCPDIMITNYSMLQYMLIRPLEQPIWEQTKEWLDSDETNKLMFIIDEAHMYKGSSGGEVALLIRRFMHKLGIKRERIQFILTSASVPKDDLESVKEFACDLTGVNNENYNFELLTGDRQEISWNSAFEIDPFVLKDIDTNNLKESFDVKLDCIKDIASLLNWDISNYDLADEKNISIWLYKKLSKCTPMLRIIDKSRGNATKFEELANIAFPNADIKIAQKSTNILLMLAHLAKSKEGNVFLPTRLHLMFRGLKGISACINPNCQYADEYSQNLGVGKIYIGNHIEKCECGSKVYELVNDRTCGAIFLKGYLDTNNKDFIWSKLGNKYDNSFKEVHFYIISKNPDYNKHKEDKVIQVESSSGQVLNNDNITEGKNYIRLVYSTNESKENKSILTFKSCPKCGKLKLKLTDFITKGNEPFFNLVSEQFYIQPQTIFDDDKIEKTPNAGRKVLLFSDSRQKAAILAKDLTRAADEDAMKKALTIAAIELQEWAKENTKLPTMNLLYVSFLKVAAENKLRFFYGEDESTLKKAIAEMLNKLARNRPIQFDKMKSSSNIKDIPSLYYEQLIKQLCSNFRSLTDVGLCWVIPVDENDLFEDIEDAFDKCGIHMNIDEFCVLFSAWANEIITDTYSIGSEITYSVRGKVTPYFRFGLEDKKELPTKYKDILTHKGYSSEQINVIYKQLSRYLSKGDNGNLYLNLDLISLKYDEKHVWYKCPRCSNIFPYTLWGTCARCGKSEPIEMQQSDYDRMNFWRRPVIKSINGDKKTLMTRINVEEHTAQLSHKDGKQNTWSTTEDFEMRFQNVYANEKNDKPIDILSCTTTMEVGIDIGSLTAVGLRNIPPMRENYQQRAGRAGRRSSSISTIVTYTDNGPYDSYYFSYPEKIISGEARKPWIDINNKKLFYRHINTIILSSYCDIDSITITEFFDEGYQNFIKFVKEKKFDDLDIEILLPEKIEINDYRVEELISKLNLIKEDVYKFPENYLDENGNSKKMLDILLEEGVFPTYSFPRNVVGFHIEDKYGDKIIEKPDRAIDLALSEYAPGRVVVVNKKSYKSGGIYNYHSKLKSDKPAEKYTNNKDYFKLLYYCDSKECTWQDYEMPQSKKCPFCETSITKHKHVVKPWGFAPINGTSISEAKAESELSYATDPSYSLPINETHLIVADGLKNVRFVKLANQQLTIVNNGIYDGREHTGFTMCKLCGAIVPGNEREELNKIGKPFRSNRTKLPCTHPEATCENVFLGTEVLSDMVLFEIKIDSNKFDTSSENIWLKSAVISLSESMLLSAGRILDIDFKDLSCGHRIRYGTKFTCVDIFIYDNLSSGAGYSSALADRCKELFDETKITLESCRNNCDTACQECLKHFWNQKKHNRLSRKLGLDLLHWINKNDIVSEIPISEQIKIFEPLGNLISPEYTFEIKNDKIVVIGNQKEYFIYIYPACWNKSISKIPSNTIALQDNLILYSLPEAYRQLKYSISNT